MWKCPKCGYTFANVEPRHFEHGFRCVCRTRFSSWEEGAPGSCPAGLPGRELLKLFAAHGIPPKPGCTCKMIAAEMDRLGVAGCREHRDCLLKKILCNWQHYTWSETIGAGLKLRKQPWFKITDALGSCFDEAVRRAEQCVSS